MATAAGSGTRSRFGLLLFLVVLLAFVLREQFVLFGVVDFPIRGDVREYFAYAWNLANHGIFSHTPPGTALPTPDAYRSPGYPWLLALCLWMAPQDLASPMLGAWYPLALQLQVLLGTATVLLVTQLGRTWMSGGWSLLAGLLLALWPHHIAATGALLSEVAFGFALIAALFCVARAWKSERSAWWLVAGAAFGYAYLVNPLIALFPPALVLFLWSRKRTGGPCIMLLVSLLPIALLALRNSGLPKSTEAPVGRAALNVVQGSWPNYHAAHSRYYSGDRVAVAIMDEINREARVLEQQPQQGIELIAKRLASDPVGYARWYLWDKPWLLWDWNIRLGFGGFYFQEVHRSPLDNKPLLRALFDAWRAVNPLLSLALLASALVACAMGWRRSSFVPAACVGGLVLYLTLIHMVFQAEPRYANAYRGVEALLVASSMAAVAHCWRHRPRVRAGNRATSG